MAIKTVSEDALRFSTVILISYEVWLPNELQLSVPFPLLLLLFVHPGKYDSLKAQLSHNPSISRRMAKSIKLPPDRRPGAKLLPDPVMSLLKVPQHVSVVRTCLICRDHASMDDIDLAIPDESLDF